MSHVSHFRVYYEDTDLAGIVYYANYLRFIERGRSDWLRDLGIEQRAMKEETGTVFAVRRLEADYLKPAKFEDLLTVVTRLDSLQGARMVMSQEVRRGEELLFAATVTIACLNEQGGPTRIPEAVRRALTTR